MNLETKVILGSFATFVAITLAATKTRPLFKRPILTEEVRNIFLDRIIEMIDGVNHFNENKNLVCYKKQADRFRVRNNPKDEDKIMDLHTKVRAITSKKV